VGKKTKKPRKQALEEDAFPEVHEDTELEIVEETAMKDYRFEGKLEIGDIVVVHLAEFSEEFPQIGQVS
jgi:hypothetical protein